jgi:hypothetical protein
MAGKADIEAGRAFVRLFLKNDLSKQLAGVMKSAGESVKQLGAGAMRAGAGLTAGGLAILAPLGAAVAAYTSMGGAAMDAAARTGLSVEAISELSFAAEQTGASFGDVETATKRMAVGIGDLAAGSQAAQDRFASLGLTLADLQGLSPEDQFTKISAAIAKIENPTMRTAAAVDMFGRSGTNLLPMIGDLDQLRAKARDLGIVMSGDAAAGADELGDAIDQVKSQVTAAAFQIGAALAPAVLSATKTLSGLLAKGIEWVQQNRGLLQIIAAVGSSLLVAGAAVTALGAALFAGGIILTTLGAALGTVLSPIGLLVAGLVAGVAAWFRFSDSGRTAWRKLVAGVLPIVETLKQTLGGVTDAVQAGQWALAGKVAIAGLKLAFFQGLSAIEQAFPATFATILRTVGKIGDGLVSAWGATTGFLTTQWNNWGKATLDTILEVARLIPDIWQTAVASIAEMFLSFTNPSSMVGKSIRMAMKAALLPVIAITEMSTRKKIDADKLTEGVIARAMGGDMGKMQESAQEIEAARRPLMMRNLEYAIAKGKESGADTSQLERELEQLRAGPKTVDVFADARRAVADYTSSLRGNLAAGGTAGEGAVSGSLEKFLQKLQSGVSVTDAQAELKALQAELAAAKKQVGNPKFGGWDRPPPDPDAGPAAVPAAVPRGVAIGPTYSAAAAQAAGQMGNGPNPQDKMIVSIRESTQILRELGVLSAKQTLASERAVATQERWLASLTFG